MERISTIKDGVIVPLRTSPRAPKPTVIVDANVCLVCKGAGWLRRDVPLGHSEFGKLVKCQCKSVEEVKMWLAKTYTWLGAGAQDELESMTFASFRPNANGKWVAQAYRRARVYAEQLKSQVEGQISSVLLGPYGIGKTHLACAILNAVRAQGVPCLFVSGNQLFQALYASDFDENIIKKAIDVPVLCFDDLDKMQVKDDGSYQKTTLFNLFNQRYLAKRPCIITTNAEDDLRQWLHGAVLSRLFGNAETISMAGDDFRLVQHG